MVVQIKSLGLIGIEAYDVSVETDITRGMSSFDIVGLPDASVKEARERVRSAIGNCGFEFPKKRVVINLAPADIKKTGSYYDLPILISILVATGALNDIPSDTAFIGELSLSGEVRSVNGILPMAIQAQKEGIRQFFVPADNACEGAVVEGIDIVPVRHVLELIRHLRGQQSKSMLAKRLPTILPDMTFAEMIESTKIHSVAGLLDKSTPLLTHRPFRAPHHTVSSAGLSGGGSIPHPGEISLAHNGVLFLDELPEFKRNVMEILRQPMEDGMVTISRVNATLTYPCTIMVIAAMNPCPCGYFGHPTRPCTCHPSAVAKYLAKISGPLLDRLDLHVEVPPVEFTALSSTEQEESSAAVKQRVNAVRQRQQERFQNTGVFDNAHIPAAKMAEFCPLDDSASAVLKASFEKLGLSARAYSRLLKVARTIADMDNSEVIRRTHIFESIQYRTLDRKYWSAKH